MSKAPASVMVVSILGIIYSALGIIGAPVSLFIMFVGFGLPNPAMDAMRNDHAYMTVMLISVSIGFLASLLLLAGSIASLKLIRWGRLAMLTYAWLLVVHMILATIIQAVWMLPRMTAAMEAGAAGGAGGPGGAVAAKAGMVGGLVGAVFGLLFVVGVVITIIYVFTRPHVIDAFNGIFPADRANFPVQFPLQPPAVS